MDSNKDSDTKSYQVLARKYRPSSFSDLIGQESLVQTLQNALDMGRLAHAFVLTGLRGIGKTSTARIIAKGLNCTGEDGQGGPTLAPCGVCSSCVSITAGHHVDVLEMDAASNTGVDDVREIIEGVSYRPLSARYKVYIIDEVHMLSKSAFNALLKTLEEPPAAVKFIFATTEIRKVPVTILSRCQRFDLRRVPVPMMLEHLQHICTLENIKAENAALERIARAAEGSVRDALSLLDQAAALTADNISDDAITQMLGQAGRQHTLQIVCLALEGETAKAMEKLDAALSSGAEANMVLADMLDFIHLASRIAAGGHIAETDETERNQLKALADTAGLARLGRAWQIVLKGHGELAVAPDVQAAADMVIIRLAHIAMMPNPADLVRKLEKVTAADLAPAATESKAKIREDAQTEASLISEDALPLISNNTETEIPPFKNMESLAQLFEDKGEIINAVTIRNSLSPIAFNDNSIELAAIKEVDANFSSKMAKSLQNWTGKNWTIIINDQPANDGKTLDALAEEKRAEEMDQIKASPLVAAGLEVFPDAEIVAVNDVKGD